jgi:hypothetical protein
MPMPMPPPHFDPDIHDPGFHRIEELTRALEMMTAERDHNVEARQAAEKRVNDLTTWATQLRNAIIAARAQLDPIP